MATMDGSFITMPSPRTYTRVLAVPRSMARSFENSPARILISMHPPIYLAFRGNGGRSVKRSVAPTAAGDKETIRLFRNMRVRAAPWTIGAAEGEKRAVFRSVSSGDGAGRHTRRPPPCPAVPDLLDTARSPA